MLLFLLNWSLLSQTNSKLNKGKNEDIEVFADEEIINSTIFIKPFYFEENSFTYSNQEYLEKFQLLVAEYPNFKFKLTGHSTNKEFALNPSLSEQRVQNIAHLFKIIGITDDKIEIQDLKNTQPLEGSGNDKINRRVEIYITEE